LCGLAFKKRNVAYFDRSYAQSYDARLMSERLPVQIDPIRLADEGVRLQGELSDSDMPRLRKFSAPGSWPAVVAVDLQFERAAQGVRRLRGSIHVCVQMVCQRCLKPLAVEVTARPFLTLLQSDMAADDGEALQVTAPIRLRELVEDELLLAMPMIPVHAEAECTSLTKAGAVPVTAGKENPFAVLHELKESKPATAMEGGSAENAGAVFRHKNSRKKYGKKQ